MHTGPQTALKTPPRARRKDKPQTLCECVLAGLTGRFVSPGSPQAVRQERRGHAFRVLQGVGGGGSMSRGDARGPRSEPLPSTVFPQPRPQPALPPPCLCGALERRLNQVFSCFFKKQFHRKFYQPNTSVVATQIYLCDSHYHAELMPRGAEAIATRSPSPARTLLRVSDTATESLNSALYSFSHHVSRF